MCVRLGGYSVSVCRVCKSIVISEEEKRLIIIHSHWVGKDLDIMGEERPRTSIHDSNGIHHVLYVIRNTLSRQVLAAALPHRSVFLTDNM